MAIPGHPSLVVYLGVGALIAWRMYSRIRRMVGRQKLSNVRPWISICLFSFLVAMLLLGSLSHPAHAMALAGGVAGGVVLGAYGIRLTRFEQTPAGLFYTPSLHLGIALSLLFIGRIAYRAAQLYFSSASNVYVFPSKEFSGSPLTLLIFGVLAGYYVTYAIGLLRWRYRAGTGNSSLVAEPGDS